MPTNVFEQTTLPMVRRHECTERLRLLLKRFPPQLMVLILGCKEMQDSPFLALVPFLRTFLPPEWSHELRGDENKAVPWQPPQPAGILKLFTLNFTF